MFERYTEKARRAIFFARYEASQLGSSCIRTDHLLLGILRESRDLAGYLKVDRLELEKRLRTVVSTTKVSTSVDLPLDDAARQVLSYAAEEADGMGQGCIGTEHLLLGIMCEPSGPAAQVLQALGAPSVEQVRNAVRTSELREQATVPLRAVAQAWSPVVKLIEEGERELSASLRFGSVPDIGQSVRVTVDGVEEMFRVIDVLWDFHQTSDMHDVTLTAIEVRLRKETDLKR